MRKLKLFSKIAANWLDKSHDKIYQQMVNLYLDEEFWELDLRYKKEPIKIRPIIPLSANNINPKYALLIKVILDKFHVVGIWKDIMLPETIDPVRTVLLYGYKTDVEMAENMVNYLINGFDRYFEMHVKELRRKRINRHKRGIKLISEMDARKRTNLSINRKVEIIIEQLQNFQTGDRKNKKQMKLDVIISVIDKRENIDYKKYRTMKNTTHKAMYARPGYIQVNRLV